ncbi:hypothetical protein VPH35_067711 [Triticum aestivum]
MLIAALDGLVDPVDVCLDSFLIWVQIHGLPVPLKTEAVGWALGDQLGEVKAVAHQDNQIVGEHLRVHILHKVAEPLRKTVEFTPFGKSEEISSNVKYEKLPNFCLCCGMVGHMTAKNCSIPAELRKAIYSIELKAPSWGGLFRRHIDFWGLPGAGEDEEDTEKAKLPDKMISMVATAVKNLSVAAAPVVSVAPFGKAVGSTTVVDPGLRVLGISQEGSSVLAGSGSNGQLQQVVPEQALVFGDASTLAGGAVLDGQLAQGASLFINTGTPGAPPAVATAGSGLGVHSYIMPGAPWASKEGLVEAPTEVVLPGVKAPATSVAAAPSIWMIRSRFQERCRPATPTFLHLLGCCRGGGGGFNAGGPWRTVSLRRRKGSGDHLGLLEARPQRRARGACCGAVCRCQACHVWCAYPTE